MNHAPPPGPVMLIGSGETASTGGLVFEALARRYPIPLQASVLETPAGFEGNAHAVAKRISVFLEKRLQNYKPRVSQIAARKKGTPNSPDAPDVVTPLFNSDLIFLGPGSPTYTVRQLEGSLAWHVVQARHRLGAALALASAATIASGSLALPVYEIFKVGDDPHWKPGLNLFQPFGLNLVIVPHWNNREGGEELDTSRCFIGQERFSSLLAEVGENPTVVGIDEHTALEIDFASETCRVWGSGTVHLLRAGQAEDFPASCQFAIHKLGDFHLPAEPYTGIPQSVWQQAVDSHQQAREKTILVPEAVDRLVSEREKARKGRDWELSDRLRAEITARGWQVLDTPEGPVLNQLP